MDVNSLIISTENITCLYLAENLIIMSSDEGNLSEKVCILMKFTLCKLIK